MLLLQQRSRRTRHLPKLLSHCLLQKLLLKRPLWRQRRLQPVLRLRHADARRRLLLRRLLRLLPGCGLFLAV